MSVPKTDIVGPLYLVRERDNPIFIGDGVYWTAVDATYDASKVIYATASMSQTGDLYVFERMTNTRIKLSENTTEARIAIGTVVFLADFDSTSGTRTLKSVGLGGGTPLTLATGIKGGFDTEVIIGPDYQTVFFVDGNELKRVSISGGTPESLGRVFSSKTSRELTNVGGTLFFVDVTDPATSVFG